MNYKLNLSLFIFLFSISGISDAQEKHSAPIPVELMAGNERVFFQMVLQKDFKAGGKLGYFNISNFQAAYNNSTENNEFISQNLLTYSIGKGFALTGGLVMNSVSGFRQFLGVQYVYASPKWLIVSVPDIDLQDNHNMEIMNLVEFRPKINDKWSLYTRAQGLFVYDPKEKHHARSFFLARLGLQKSAYRFGVGMNQDWYGPDKFNKPNYGVFGIISLF